MKQVVRLFIVFAIIFSSCEQNNIDSNENKLIELDEKSAKLVEADNEFGLEIFQKIRENSEEKNLMVSPLSISVALAMAYNGAEGDTKTEMEKTLKLNGLSVDEINSSYKNLIAALQSLDEDVVFELANAIYYADIFNVKPNFLQTNQNYYNAEINELDFSSPAAVETINSWVKTKTHDKIQKIINNLSPDDRMVLLNAIYFNGTWASEFDDKGTHMVPFYFSANNSEEVATMKKEDKLDYTKNNLFSAVKIPYGNGQYKMVVLLPENNKTSQDVIDELTHSNWKNWMNSFETKDRVVVSMPRFKFAFEQGLNSVLFNMGMKKAFQPFFADFSKISDEDVYISSVRHKSYIDVNETGTEAAAVTSITFTTTSAGPGDQVEKIYFTVNKPFVFAITEKDTGAILFIGEVQKPEYAE